MLPRCVESTTWISKTFVPSYACSVIRLENRQSQITSELCPYKMFGWPNPDSTPNIFVRPPT